MTEKELFEKNLELSSEFSRYIIARPEIKLPPESEIVFLVDSDPELTRANMKLAAKIKKEGGKAVFVHVKTILPKESCRLVEPTIELVAK
jgi:hypothetical protein